jgi:uncharacterized protein YkwD
MSTDLSTHRRAGRIRIGLLVAVLALALAGGAVVLDPVQRAGAALGLTASPSTAPQARRAPAELLPSPEPTAEPTAEPDAEPTAEPSPAKPDPKPPRQQSPENEPEKTTTPATARPPTQPATTSSGILSESESRVLTIVNKRRAEAGCTALKPNAKLTRAARKHSRHMERTGEFGHSGIGDGDMQSRVEAQGYAWSRLGENIAWGYPSARAVMRGWMNSPGHKANILNCSFRQIGIGRVGTYWTQNFATPA